jgi:hypothetical protein
MKLTGKAAKTAKALAKMCYPTYKGRKFAIEVRKTYTMENYWSGGTRAYVVAYHFASGKIAPPALATTFEHMGAAHSTIEIPPGVALVERLVFLGKEAGITIIVAPGGALEASSLYTALAEGLPALKALTAI